MTCTTALNALKIPKGFLSGQMDGQTDTSIWFYLS